LSKQILRVDFYAYKLFRQHSKSCLTSGERYPDGQRADFYTHVFLAASDKHGEHQSSDYNKEIAARLVLADGTVKNHVSMILEKLHAATRTQAARLERRSSIR
jgi:hypothetical protein